MLYIIIDVHRGIVHIYTLTMKSPLTTTTATTTKNIHNNIHSTTTTTTKWILQALIQSPLEMNANFGSSLALDGYDSYENIVDPHTLTPMISTHQRLIIGANANGIRQVVGI